MMERTKLPQAVRQALEEVSAGAGARAYIIEGDDGRYAGLLSQAMVCEGREDRPCGRCPHCRKAVLEQHPDITVIKGGTSARSFGVNKVRMMKSDAYVLPNEARVKVYLLQDCDNMSTAAQNALLKLLEEPPAHAAFILLCRSAQSLLPTVLSRCVTLRVDLAEGAENPEYDNFCREFANTLIEGNLSDFTELYSFFEKNKENGAEILDRLAQHFAALARDSAGVLSKAWQYRPKKRLLPIKAAGVAAHIQAARRQLDSYANYTLVVMRMLSKSWEEVH